MKTKKIISALAMLAAAAAAAGIVEETKSKPVLAATAEVAPFGDVTRKVTTFGTMINNPIVPTLMLTSGQQQLVQSYGRFRADSPICWLCYIQTPAWDVAATNSDQVAIDSLFENVLVYPSVDGPARMALNHPGSTKEPDGTIHLLPGEDRPNDTYVKFTDDGRYCAFASSPTIGARALEDFKAVLARQKGAKDAPLLRVNVTERGMTALLSLQKELFGQQEKAAAQAGTNDFGLVQEILDFQAARQKRMMEVIRSIASCTVSMDLDTTGLVLDSRLLPKPGAKPLAAGFALPGGVLDRVPASAPLFFFGGDRFASQYAEEASFKADMAAVANMMPPLFAQLAKSDDCKKVAPFLKDIEVALTQLLRDVPYPAATDWAGAWLGFDGAGHMYIDQAEQAAQADLEHKIVDRFLAQLAAAVEKQWPGKGLVAKKADGILFDTDALIDLFGAEAGVKPGDKEATDLANAKKRLATVLGSGKLACTMSQAGDMRQARFAAVGVQPAAAAQPTGEARVAAALPEIAAGRPAAVFYLAPYSFVRDAVLPVLIKMADKKNVQQYQAMMAAMPPAEANSALVWAGWVDGKGGVRALLRVTAGELENLGAAFNAFTAASMAGAANDD